MSETVETEAAPVELTLEQKVDRLSVQMDWLLGATDVTGKNVQQIGEMFNMVVQGLLASPLGGMLKAQMGVK